MILKGGSAFQKQQGQTEADQNKMMGFGEEQNQLSLKEGDPSQLQVNLIIDYTIYKIAMEQQQTMRNSFEAQYQSANQPILPGDHPQLRLSCGKQSLLQSFKESVMEQASNPSANYHMSYLDEYQNEPKYQIDLPIAQIREDSHESSQKSDSHSESQKGKNPYIVSSPRRTRVSSHEDKSNEPALNLQNNIKTLVSITSSQCPKTQLLCLIGQAVNYLGKGIEVKRYCFGKQKIQANILCFSQDFDFFSLVCSKEMRVFTIKDCIHVLIGVKTQRFQHYKTKGYQIPQETAFSLQFKQRSFDFQASSPSSRDAIIQHLRLLRECY